MKANDIFGLGKMLPIDKLVDVISKSIGKLSKPYFDRKDIDTRAYEIEKLAEAHAKEMKIIATAVNENFKITGGIEYKEEKIAISSPKEQLLIESERSVFFNTTLEERTQNRVNFQEVKKQLNIESVTAFAAEELKNESDVTDEPLNEDWTTRFFKIAEEVSNEEMQALWGKILAGEIKQPKTYSLRTLELVRNLSKREADIFMKVANLAIKSNGINFLFKTKNEKLLEQYKISYTDRALLTEIGLLQPGTFVNYTFTQNTNDYQRVFTFGNIVFVAKIKANTPAINIPVDVFTNAGNELITLINQNPPFEYLNQVVKSIKNSSIDIKYAYILGHDGEFISHTQPLQNFT